MTYEEFIWEIKETLQDRIPPEAYIEQHRILKNNSRELDSLIIRKDSENISPNFYLQDLYEQHLDGTSVIELVDLIYTTYCETTKHPPVIDLVQNLGLEHCKDKIIYRLVSRERNEKLLQEIPYIPFLDLAIIFHCLVSQEESGIGCIRITNLMAENWQISTKQLYTYAKQNTPRLLPSGIKLLRTMLEDMLHIPDDPVSFFDLDDLPPVVYPIEPYVLTNTQCINGAAVLLYPELMSHIAEHFNCNFYILPSSIHELLLMPEDTTSDPDELRQMVQEVNMSCVSAEELLSDQVYFFDRNAHDISICKTQASTHGFTSLQMNPETI